MKSKILFLATLGIVLVSGAVLYGQFKNQPQLIHEKDLGDQYYCPMHPQIQRDKPGTCPICYMKLVKKEKPSVEESVPPTTQAPQERVSVRLKSEQQQLIGVRTATVIKKDLTRTIHAYGYVAHDLDLFDQQLEYIQAWRQYFALVDHRPAKESFHADWRDYFTKSDDGQWRSQDEVKAQQRLLKAEYELRHMGLHDKQLEQLREIKSGQPWVQPDLLFFEEGHPTWIYAQVFESDLGYVAVGQSAKVTLPAYDETVIGYVETVANMIDPETRTVQVRIKLQNYRGELTANMYANVEILSELNTALLIPREALIDTGLQKIVFVQQKEGLFEPRSIETISEGDGMVAIRSGLKEGETVVVSGNFLLDSESRLKATLENADTAPSTNVTKTGS